MIKRDSNSAANIVHSQDGANQAARDIVAPVQLDSYTVQSAQNLSAEAISKSVQADLNLLRRFAFSGCKCGC